MRVLLYSLNFHPECVGVAKYNTEMFEWLHKNGFDVRVITAPPSFPGWKIFENYNNDFVVENISSGDGTYKVFRSPVYMPRNISFINRLFYLFSFFISSMWNIIQNLKWKPDVVFVTEPSFIAAPNALLFKYFSKSKIWYHIQDFEIGLIGNRGWLNAFFNPLLKFYYNLFINRCECVTTISEDMKKSINNMGVNREIDLFKNWVDASVFERVVKSDTDIYKLKINIPIDKKIIMYSGSMGAKQGVEIMALIARHYFQLEVRNLHFVFCGEGATKKDLVNSCEGLSNVSIFDLVDESELPKLLKCADIHLLPQRIGMEASVLPSKLLGMMASGKPVVVGATSGTCLANIVSMCGVVVEPESVNSYIDGLNYLISNSISSESLGRAGFDFVCETYNKSIILNQVVSKLRLMRV